MSDSALTIDHVADAYRRYPGDLITYFTRVEVAQDVADLTVRLHLPTEIVPNEYQTYSEHEDIFSDLEVTEEEISVAWRIENPVAAGTVYEYQTMVRVAPTAIDHDLVCKATALAHFATDDQNKNDDENLTAASEWVTVNVAAKGAYLQNIPSLYYYDDFMGRYLMLFESFWKPIENQVDHIWYYFDCQMAPLEFIRWLAHNWLSLELDPTWPEEKQRDLICMIIQLYRRRGTKWGLQKFLEIYTGVVPDIVEHRSQNFALGPNARLGQGVALGSMNRPHTFTVSMTLPPIPPEAAQNDEVERERMEVIRKRTIERIVEAEKPAHTGYNLQLTIE